MLKNSTELIDENELKQIVYDCINVINDMRVSGFEHNQTRLSEIETALFDMLLTKHYNEIGYDKITLMISPIIDLAKIHYSDVD